MHRPRLSPLLALIFLVGPDIPLRDQASHRIREEFPDSCRAPDGVP